MGIPSRLALMGLVFSSPSPQPPSVGDTQVSLVRGKRQAARSAARPSRGLVPTTPDLGEMGGREARDDTALNPEIVLCSSVQAGRWRRRANTMKPALTPILISFSFPWDALRTAELFSSPRDLVSPGGGRPGFLNLLAEAAVFQRKVAIGSSWCRGLTWSFPEVLFHLPAEQIVLSVCVYVCFSH